MTLKPIQIYDTTLRDGSQGEGVSFSLQDKLNIARRLAESGIDIIEGGYPLSNEKDVAFFEQIRQFDLGLTQVCASCQTRRLECAPNRTDESAQRKPRLSRLRAGSPLQ